jgi:hypothetical protein
LGVLLDHDGKLIEYLTLYLFEALFRHQPEVRALLSLIEGHLARQELVHVLSEQL